MHRTLIKNSLAAVDKQVLIKGWVDSRRDHGKLIFLDIRDTTGTLQVVVNPEISQPAHDIASSLRNEFVVAITGKINKRPDKLVNDKLATGSVEIEATEIEILNKSKELPFEIDKSKGVNEEVRLKYRYLDLRNKKMSENIKLRHRVTCLAREFLNGQGFLEIETPLLTKTSPEGARDFLVPSRMHPGKFYALPQAPQQYKQILMISGFERYYQIARAMRDEDLRGDRQLEHTQIDMEMSFVSEDDVFDLVEGLMAHIVEGVGKQILKKPFPRFTYDEAMKKFGADKFDLRENKDDNTLAFAWVTKFPLFEKDAETGRLTFAHNPFSSPRPEDEDKLMNGEDLESLHAQQYDLVCNGIELASGGVRISNPKIQQKVFEIMGLNKQQVAERFGHLLEAYEYGAPPHAGIAPGLDRLVMVLAGEENIREVIAFPVTSTGKTSVMDAPSNVDPKQLKELGIKIHKEDLP